MHCGLNSSAAVRRLTAHYEAQSCVYVCWLISKAPEDLLAAAECVETV